MNLKWLFYICLFPFSCLALTCHIGVIGDSISVPYPADPNESYHYLITQELRQQGYDVRVINYSTGCSGTDTLSLRFEEMLEEDVPDILIIALGVNDAYVKKPYHSVVSKINKAVQKAKELHIPILIGSVDVSGIGWKGQMYNNNFIHLYEFWADDPYVSVFPLLTRSITLDRSLSFDKVHPTAEGHRLIADTLKPLLIPLVDEIKRTRSKLQIEE